MTQLAVGTDFVQVPADGAGKKTAFFVAAVSGGNLYVPASIPVDSTGNLLVDSDGTFVVGKVASGSADSGGPVKVGGRYNTTPPTLTNGQRGDVQLSVAGRALVSVSDPSSADTAAVVNLSSNVGSSVVGLVVNSRGLTRNSTGMWEPQDSLNAVQSSSSHGRVQATAPPVFLYASQVLQAAQDSLISWDLAGESSLVVRLATSRTGSFKFIASIDGVNFHDPQVRNMATGAWVTGQNITPASGAYYEVFAPGSIIVVAVVTSALSGTCGMVASSHWSSRLSIPDGGIASGAADSGNPVKVGGRYNSTPPTLTDGQRGDLQLDSSGSLKVALGGSLPAGTANIGDVDVLTVPAPLSTTGGGTEAAALRVTVASDSTGVLSIDDNGGSLSIDDGGNVITVDGTVAVTNADLSTLAGAVRAEDVASANAHTGIVNMAVRKDTPADTSDTDGDYEMLQMKSGRLWTSATIDAALPAGNANIGDVDVASVAAGTTIEAVGDVASDVPIAANPVTIGGRASSAAPTDVGTDGDAVNIWLTRKGTVMVTQLPHAALDGAPYTLTSKTVQTTTTQTGSDVWTPTSGKKLVIVSYQIQVGGTTAGTVQIWFGANADTSYTRGTDLAIFDGEFAPSATLKPGVVQTGLWIASAADHEVHLTTSAAINPLTITLWGYEI